MMEWTDRHCRYFLRLIADDVRLYTEMVTSAALIHGDRDRLLRHHPAERPLALQVGGSEPDELARCARWGEQAGFDEINLNVGCPSDRVQAGRFWINTTLAGGPELPIGGFKQSGWGREAGVMGVEEYTQVKSTHIEIGKRSHWIG